MRQHVVFLAWLALAGVACTETRDPAAGAASGQNSDAGQRDAGAAPAADGGGAGHVAAAAGGGSVQSGSAGATTPAGMVFSPYKDTSISMNWQANVISSAVSGTLTAITSDVAGLGLNTLTLAFATGECGEESWGGVGGAALATANADALRQAGIRYILSTGGARDAFTCASDAGMETFIARWAGPGLVGVDFDIEGGQTPAIIDDLIARVGAAHAAHPKLRFSLTLATLASSDAGQDRARSRGAQAEDNFNSKGTSVLTSVKSKLAFTGEAATWPDYLTVNLMTMHYGSTGPKHCVVSGDKCQMGQSALQAAYNLHDHWGVPYRAIELTPLIGGSDASSELFTLSDVDTVTDFARAMQLAGLHFWSYDRDRDCMPGPASATCNSFGSAGTRGYLQRFLQDLSK